MFEDAELRFGVASLELLARVAPEGRLAGRPILVGRLHEDRVGALEAGLGVADTTN